MWLNVGWHLVGCRDGDLAVVSCMEQLILHSSFAALGKWVQAKQRRKACQRLVPRIGRVTQGNQFLLGLLLHLLHYALHHLFIMLYLLHLTIVDHAGGLCSQGRRG
jgi:hypothetical protein